ncbi:hypothetical protein ABZ354_26175, partial [Streptomyces sp. NPDC005925]|uniref:hypothetical protein n=1 Tax=Streptomyces sp. NPDC005925 TaxID=3157172 RepID=UPI0033DCC30F
VVTTVFTGGAGGAAAGAGKAGAVAKALSVAGRAGRFIDPMTYIAKGAGAGLSRLGDISAALKGVGAIDIPALPEGAIALPEGAVRLPDGTVNLPGGAALPDGAARLPDGNVKLPDGATVLPPGTVRLPTGDGVPAQYMDPDGNLLDGRGNAVQQAADGPGDIVDRPGTTSGAPGADNPRVDSPVREPALVGAGAHTADTAAHPVRLGSDLGDDLGRVGDDLGTPGGHVEGPGGTAGDNLPGGTAGHHLPTNSIDTPAAPVGTADNAVPGGAGTADHVPGGHAGDPGHGPSGGHDLPGGGHDLPPRPDGPSGGGPDDLGRAVDDSVPAGADGTPPVRDAEAARPDFMRDGDNPYGPEGSLTPEQVHEIQVYRANHESGYFDDFYKSNGNRKNLDFVDESGRTPPQLTRQSPQHPWTTVKDAPEPLRPRYLDDAVKVGRETASPEALSKLDEAAASRHHAVDYDQAAGRHKADAVEAHKTHPTPESELTRIERTNEYKAAHRDMRDHAEAYGEAVAEHHVVPERYPNATREPLDGPLNGNDQFDQVWRREDGGYVVVEAKSSVDTELGARNLPNGKRVSQGTREYFLDILHEMRKRGEDNPSELLLADDLEAALARGDVDYIVVKGQRNTGEYAGYSMREFDIADRSTP